ncbi:MAG: hypothetical protein GF331_00110 [Chitinivibrionales bacterium]|nr:hypothetical protein [Chitinivibrionales bacterium]
MWRAYVNIIAGIWAFISGLTETLVTPVNMIITGLVIAVFGFWTPARKWQGIVNGILGLWLFLSGFIPGLWAGENMLIVGLIVFALAVWRAIDLRPHGRAEARRA